MRLSVLLADEDTFACTVTPPPPPPPPLFLFFPPRAAHSGTTSAVACRCSPVCAPGCAICRHLQARDSPSCTCLGKAFTWHRAAACTSRDLHPSMLLCCTFYAMMAPVPFRPLLRPRRGLCGIKDLHACQCATSSFAGRKKISVWARRSHGTAQPPAQAGICTHPCFFVVHSTR